MKYKLKDLQGAEMHESMTFNSKEEIHEHLKNYHSADNDTTNWTLDDCLDIGCWEIIELPTKNYVETYIYEPLDAILEKVYERSTTAERIEIRALQRRIKEACDFYQQEQIDVIPL